MRRKRRGNKGQMLYSCVPYDVIMGLQEAGEYEIIRLTCGYARVRRTESGWELFSLASTDPRAYLRPEWTPGAKMEKPSGKDSSPFSALGGSSGNGIPPDRADV